MMQAPVDILPEDLAVVWGVLEEVLPSGSTIWAFGSRARWTTRNGSDLDLAVDAGRPLTRREASVLAVRFEDSDIPYKVDVVDLHRVSPAFRAVIDRDKVGLPYSPPEDAGGGGWQTVRLGECARFVSGGTPSMREPRYWGGDIPWVSAKDLKTLGLDESQDHITELGAENGTRLVDSGTILLLTRGMTLHNDVPICVAKRRMAFNQDIKAVIPADGVDGRFLLYAILARKPQLLAMVDSAGHGTGRLNTDQLKALPISVPPFPVQHAIADILGSLDDKIELNRRTNETLEAMAMALFKSWFVDFDPVVAKSKGRQPEGMDAETATLFPSSFVDSEIGRVPKGWRVGRFGDVAYSRRDIAGVGDFSPETAYIGLEHMPRNRVAISEWGDASAVESAKSRFSKGDFLFGKLRPYFHKVGIAPVDGVCSTDILVIVPRMVEWSAFVLGHASSDELVDFADGCSTGTRMPRVSWGDLSRYPLPMPPPFVARQLAQTLAPVFAAIVASTYEVRSLISLRDTLLPKLLTGDLRIAAPDKFRAVV